MAVYTHVDQASLDAFLAAYDLGRALALEGIAEGVENSNYRLVTERGRYILTLYEKRVDPDDLPFFLGLMNHLAAKGVPCPTPIRARDGAALQQPVRPAGGDRQLSRRRVGQAGRGGALRGARSGAGAAASRRRGFRAVPAEHPLGHQLAGPVRGVPRRRRPAARGAGRRSRPSSTRSSAHGRRICRTA